MWCGVVSEGRGGLFRRRRRRAEGLEGEVVSISGTEGLEGEIVSIPGAEGLEGEIVSIPGAEGLGGGRKGGVIVSY